MSITISLNDSYNVFDHNKDIDMKKSMYSHQKRLFDFLWKVTLAVFVASILIACMCDTLVNSYVSSLLISSLPSLALATLMAKMMSSFLRRQAVENILESLFSIRSSIIQIISNANFYGMEKECREHEWYWLRICDYSERIEEMCVSLIRHEFFRAVQIEIYPGFGNLHKLGREIRFYIDSALCKKTHDDADAKWIERLKDLPPQYLKDVEAAIRNFAAKYCPEDLPEIEKYLARIR